MALVETKPGDGFNTQEGATAWIRHVESGVDPFRRGALYPYIQKWIGRLGLPTGSRVLDVCCGQGVSSALLIEHGLRVIGIDISAPLITRAKEVYAGNSRLEFKVWDAASLASLRRKPFAAATCINGLFHLPPDKMVGLFAGLAVIIKSGGQILVTTVNPEADREFAAFYENQSAADIQVQPPLVHNTHYIIGEPRLPGPDGDQVVIPDTPFYMHSLPNVEAAIEAAGLEWVKWPPETLAPLSLTGGPQKDLFMAFELQVPSTRE